MSVLVTNLLVRAVGVEGLVNEPTMRAAADGRTFIT